MSPTAWLVIAGSIIGLVTGLITVWVFIRPGIRRRRAADEAILGTEPIPDRSGEGNIREGTLGLVQLQRNNAKQIAKLEETARETASAVKTLAEVVAEQAGVRAEVDAIRAGLTRADLRLNDHELRLKAQELATEERIEIRRESAAVFRAVADRDVIDVDNEES